MTAFCNTLKLNFFTRTIYDKFLKLYIGPVICNVWEKEKKNVKELKNGSNKIWLGGDGQFDSPGFCAKYCTYSIMDAQTGKIIGFKLVQKLMVQGDLERYACGSLLNELVSDENCKIDIFLTERHKNIPCDMRINHSNIEHEFDIWHISKSLMKRMKTLNKKYPDAFLWKTSISNHLWWSGGQHKQAMVTDIC